MDWIVLSLFTAVCYSAHSLLQKYAFQRYVRSILAFSFWGESFQALVGMAILLAHPVPYPLLSIPVLLLLAGAVARVGMVLLRAWAIQREEEVSRIVPVLDTYPVFVALLAVLVLGERLVPLHWVAIFLIVGGVFFASSHEALGTRRLRQRSTVMVALGFSVGAAVYSILGKAALAYVDVWHLIGVSSLLTAPTSALVARRLGAWPELVSLPRRGPALGITAASAGAIVLAFGMSFAAFDRGPVSLSAAIMATRPILIVAYAVLVGQFFPRLVIEPTARMGLRSKALAAIFVTLGVAALAFQ